MDERMCGVCGRKYVPTEPNQRRTCSEVCRVIWDSDYNRQHVREWRLKNLERSKEAKRLDYQKNKDRYKERARLWRLNNPEQRKVQNKNTNDRVVHGGFASLIRQKHDNKCQKCGKETTGFDAIVHHVTFVPSEHETQTLLCRSCHKTLHLVEGRWKDKQYRKEEILKVLSESKNNADAARKLGIATATLLNKRREYGLHIEPRCGGKGGKGRYKPAVQLTERTSI